MSEGDCLRYLAACAVALRVGVDQGYGMTPTWVWRDLREMAFEVEQGGNRNVVRKRLSEIVSGYDALRPSNMRKRSARAADLYRRALRVVEGN